LALLSELKWCDVFLQNNISLRTWWPRFFVRRPFFITHQTWIFHERKRSGWTSRLKLSVLRTARNFAISRAIAAELPVHSVVVGNPYDDQMFRNLENADRSGDLIFVGRLVSDKGVDLLLRALAALRQSGIQSRLTIVGDGPERPALERQAQDLGLSASITFVGQENGSGLAERLNHHRILVVPSRWPEPFGIVALEAIACGCVVVGSAEGGLPEAIGPCGLTFPNGNEAALAAVLRELLENPQRVAELRSGAGAHLGRFSRREVAKTYLQEMGKP
jgi:glycosyltransferase involved in cell wall biosynthesis